MGGFEEVLERKRDAPRHAAHRERERETHRAMQPIAHVINQKVLDNWSKKEDEERDVEIR